MAPKNRAAKPSTLPEPPSVLSPETLADLRYLEPARTRDRVISAFNEVFLRVMTLEHMHAEEKPKSKF